ncbi:MAG TPA: DCC1-like thiol-disulfide oxidoreductase family protein [Candidatus Limnocylindrales bacterium]|nr:DCC1-like thiol-disulfide oxidoreductase family protein [Candidatus Limnocylindrales bacterium]
MSWHEAWTGGQYSVVRAGGALVLMLHFAGRMTDAASFAGAVLAALAVAAAGLFAAGRADRVLALVLAAALAMSDHGLLGRTGIWYATFWLLGHATLPPAPFLSLDARARTDPGGEWRMPSYFPAAAWALFVGHHVFGSIAALSAGEWPIALVRLPLALAALAPSTMPAALAVSLGVELGAWFVAGHADAGVWLLHLLALQPAWFPPRENAGTETVFYDGTCALCHGATRFLLSEDREPARFRLAPLGSEAFQQRLRREQREELPDSVVVGTAAGHVLTQSRATAYILDRIGGLWRILAYVLELLPDSLTDSAYEIVARNRYRWFGRKSQACPILAGPLRARFDS